MVPTKPSVMELMSLWVRQKVLLHQKIEMRNLLLLKKLEFLTDIERPQLEFWNGRRGMRRARNPSVRGGPSSNLKVPYDAIPKDFFDSFINSKCREKVTKDYANMRSVMEEAGVEGNKYSDLLSFSLGDIDAFIGLLILNGLSPKPRIE